LTFQQLRAVERGRGRGARTPSQIPRRGWKDVIVRHLSPNQDNRVLAVATGVAFYSLVALFPAIAAGVSSYALFANVATISKHLSIASDIIPAGSLDPLWRHGSTRSSKSLRSAVPAERGPITAVHPRRPWDIDTKLLRHPSRKIGFL
jgi:hypothetical protein